MVHLGNFFLHTLSIENHKPRNNNKDVIRDICHGQLHVTSKPIRLKILSQIKSLE